MNSFIESQADTNRPTPASCGIDGGSLLRRMCRYDNATCNARPRGRLRDPLRGAWPETGTGDRSSPGPSAGFGIFRRLCRLHPFIQAPQAKREGQGIFRRLIRGGWGGGGWGFACSGWGCVRARSGARRLGAVRHARASASGAPGQPGAGLDDRSRRGVAGRPAACHATVLGRSAGDRYRVESQPVIWPGRGGWSALRPYKGVF